MANFTDIFIKRPVLATVISLFILILGITSIDKLSIQEYPTIENTNITITTIYPGANANTVQSFVTTPIEKSVASTNGIDYLTSSSSAGVSTITAHIKLNYDGNAALTDITGKVSAAQSVLPQETKKPVISKTTGDNFPDLIVGFSSDSLTPEQITAYIKNVITPKFMSVGGLSNVVVFGEKDFAMRIWLDPKKMAQYSITATQVSQALINQNIQASPGKIKTQQHYIEMKAESTLHSAEEFNNLVILNKNGNLIKIKDIGHAELGAEEYDSKVFFNNKDAVFAGAQVAPGVNPLVTIDNIIKNLPDIKRALIPGLDMKVVYNKTTYIKLSIKEVAKTIIEATIIVIIVIFCFLGALRSVLIPVMTIPLSLVGVCFLMMIMGFSINLLTLLAMVLAIGLVVDDAIVVLENIYRHLENGMSPYDAAIKGAREITGPIIVMTLTLAAVFAPVGFIGGISGALFKEFAFTLAGSVIISGIIALTISPMLCSKIINKELMETKVVKTIDNIIDKIKNVYEKSLSWTLDCRFATSFTAIILFIAMIGMFFIISKNDELAPAEDQGILFVQAMGPATANINYSKNTNKLLSDNFNKFPEMSDSFLINGFGGSPNVTFGGLILKPWDQRKKTAMQINGALQIDIKNNIAGAQAMVIPPPTLPGSSNVLPVQFILQTTSDYATLSKQMDQIVTKAKKSGYFMVIIGDLKFNNYQLDLHIDRDKAAALGINISDITHDLTYLFSENNINYFSMDNYNYKVIPLINNSQRLDPKQLNNIYLNTKNGTGPKIPLSSVVTWSYETQPTSLERFQQLNSATIMAKLMPGKSLGEALEYLKTIANEDLPKTTQVNYAEQSRQFIQEGNALIYAFLVSILIIYLLLAAQFESFTDPLIILSAVPLTLFAALLPLFFKLSIGEPSLNIYTKIGFITLIGLIAKHGILLVEFANKLQEEEGLSIRDAMQKSAVLRLRPILMTTAAMVVGVVPLVFAAGAGAVSRSDIGMVIFWGLLIGTGFTLYIVPTIYTYLAKDHNPKNSEQKKSKPKKDPGKINLESLD